MKELNVPKIAIRDKTLILNSLITEPEPNTVTSTRPCFRNVRLDQPQQQWFWRVRPQNTRKQSDHFIIGIHLQLAPLSLTNTHYCISGPINCHSVTQVLTSTGIVTADWTEQNEALPQIHPSSALHAQKTLLPALVSNDMLVFLQA